MSTATSLAFLLLLLPLSMNMRLAINSCSKVCLSMLKVPHILLWVTGLVASVDGNSLLANDSWICMRILFLHPSLHASAGLAGFVIPWTSVKWLNRFFSALTLLHPLCLSGWTPVLCVCQCFSPSLFLSRYKKLTRTLMASVHVLMVTDDLAHSWLSLTCTLFMFSVVNITQTDNVTYIVVTSRCARLNPYTTRTQSMKLWIRLLPVHSCSALSLPSSLAANLGELVWLRTGQKS